MMPISPELKEDFDLIKSEILRRYKNAKKYEEIFDPGSYPYTWPFLRQTSDALEPLAKIVKRIDLDGSYEEDLKLLARQWRETMNHLPGIYNQLSNLNMAYDTVWDNMDQLNAVGDNCFKQLNLEDVNKANKEEHKFNDKRKEKPEEKSENTQQANEQNQKQRNMQKTDVAQKQDEVDRALETKRQESRENPGKGNEQQEKAIREQLKEKEPLEKGDSAGGKKIDRPRAFKKGSENVKKLAQSNQQKMMAYYRKKRKDEWSDY